MTTDTNTMQSILAKLAALEAANAKLATDNAKLIEQANKARGVTVRVTESGGIGIFGGRLRKFGASFYATEWHTILSNIDQVRTLIEAQLALPEDKRVLTVKSVADWTMLKEIV